MARFRGAEEPGRQSARSTRLLRALLPGRLLRFLATPLEVAIDQWVEVAVEQPGLSRLLKPFIQFSHKRNRLNSLKAIKAILEQS